MRNQQLLSTSIQAFCALAGIGIIGRLSREMKDTK
jgi:hypothetical protein